MSVQSALAAGRAAKAARMRDTCRITAPGAGAPTIDPVTLQYVDPTATVVYEGPCRIPNKAAGGISVSRASGGEASWQVGEYPLELPIEGSEAVAPGHTVTYLTAADDPALVGLVFGITEPDRQSQATARRFRMKQVVGGGS